MRPPLELKALPGKPGDPVDAQDVATTVVQNYTASRKNSEQLKGLQGWLRAQKKGEADVLTRTPANP